MRVNAITGEIEAYPNEIMELMDKYLQPLITKLMPLIQEESEKLISKDQAPSLGMASLSAILAGHCHDEDVEAKEAFYTYAARYVTHRAVTEQKELN